MNKLDGRINPSGQRRSIKLLGFNTIAQLRMRNGKGRLAFSTSLIDSHAMLSAPLANRPVCIRVDVSMYTLLEAARPTEWSTVDVRNRTPTEVSLFNLTPDPTAPDRSAKRFRACYRKRSESVSTTPVKRTLPWAPRRRSFFRYHAPVSTGMRTSPSSIRITSVTVHWIRTSHPSV